MRKLLVRCSIPIAAALVVSILCACLGLPTPGSPVAVAATTLNPDHVQAVRV